MSYSLTLKSQVYLAVYNALCERVTQLVNEEKEAVKYFVEIRAESLPTNPANCVPNKSNR